MEIDTSRYYWKNDLITLRRPKAEDWESLIYHMFDSQGRFFFNEEIDLPVDVEQYKGRPEFINPEQLPYLCFAIENSQGKHVGIANLFNVNERHGTFGPIGIVINPQDRGNGYGTGPIACWAGTCSRSGECTSGTTAILRGTAPPRPCTKSWALWWRASSGTCITTRAAIGIKWSAA